MSAAPPAALVRAASAYYRPAGRFALHSARGKLAGDPVYAAVLREGLLPAGGHLLDLGCGQGLLAAWLLAAQAHHALGQGWPQGWPAPPGLSAYTGVEVNPQEVRRARAAFALDTGIPLRVVHGDIRDVDYGAPHAIALLDVLHYLDRAAQERVLQRARAALRPGGRLLMRIGDGAAGFGCTFSKAFDSTVALLRRRRWIRLHCRPAAEWSRHLQALGCSVRRLPQAAGTPFANVLLIAQVP